MKIKDLKKVVGTKGLILANIQVEEKYANNGNLYLKVVFDDGDKIFLNIWNSHLKFVDIRQNFKSNDLVEATIEYCGVNASGYDEYKLDDIVKKERLSLKDCVLIEELKVELRDIISNIRHPELKNIAFSIFKDEKLKNDFFTAPASEKSGYSFKGGLLAHTVRLCKGAKAMAEVYNTWFFNKNNINERVNEDLLIVACLLHDIGKTRYYKFVDDEIEKTVEGHLFESSYLTSKISNDFINKSSLNEEQKMLLEHVITSSKGNLAKGALNLPRTKEAIIFKNLEEMDSNIGSFEFMRKMSLGNDFYTIHQKEYCLMDFNN